MPLARMTSIFVRSILGVLALGFVTSASCLGVSCEDHPAYRSGLKSVLLKSWEVLSNNVMYQGMYHVAHSKHRFAPVADESSMVYDQLDWFWVTKAGPTRGNYVRLSFQRPAKVYLAIPYIPRRSGRIGFLKGWQSEGYIKLVKGKGQPWNYGLYQSNIRPVGERMYLFSQKTKGEIVLPNAKWVKKYSKGISVTGDWIVMVAEEDGSRPEYPMNPPGIHDRIVPNARCPDALHDMWVTKSTDENDNDTRGKTWQTWHPQWDPCYWCAYDHEHGSSPKHLMGYEPKFHYTAWKNGRESESHEGYKGIVFRYKDVFVYYMVHAQTSELNRVSRRHHTILLAMTHAKTKELLVEISHKGDFGFVGVKMRNGKTAPLTYKEREMYNSQREHGIVRHVRSINVIDLAKPSPAYMYRFPRREMRRGVYESWTTLPLCAAKNKLGTIIMDMTSAATGIQRATTAKPKKVILGWSRKGRFFRQTGEARLLRVLTLAVGDDHCSFKVKNMHGIMKADGSFYTDAHANLLLDGPGRDRIRQYVKPGFNIKIGGKFGAVESWTGLYQMNAKGTMVNYGYSLHPDKN